MKTYHWRIRSIANTGHARTDDGGPYKSPRSALKTAMRVRAELLEHKAPEHVGPCEITEHDAPEDSRTVEDVKGPAGEGELWELQQENRSLKDQLAGMSKSHAKTAERLGARIGRREEALLKIREILAPYAANRRFMQIAGSAQQCINIVNNTVPNVTAQPEA